MPLQGVRTVAQGQNGVGAFILQCKQLSFHWCDYGGSSRGMHAFLKHNLAAFAKQSPGIEIRVSPRPNHHPVIVGKYINGRERSICVRGLEKEQILQKALLLRNTNGEKNRREVKPVKSLNESVRGIWDPFHQPAHKI